MRNETPPATITFEALLFGFMVGVIATTALTTLGGVSLLVSALAGVGLAVVVCLVVTVLGKPMSAPQGQKAPEATPLADTPTTSAASSKPAPAAAAAQPARGTQPVARAAAHDGVADDLKRIKGVGPKLEELLHSMGYHNYDQIAAWTDDEVAWMDNNLEGFKGRVSRDAWVAQAKELAGSR